jgi:uncharacterized protein YfaS (alpha-2-macroglobulin family)
MNLYDVGDLVRCTGAFANSAGVAVDPAAVFCKVRKPEGTVTLYTYGVDGALVKAAAGNYYVDVPITASGVWYYRFYSTGIGQTAGETAFRVRVTYF